MDVVGVSSIKRRGSNTVELDDGWKLFYSDVKFAQLELGILVSSQLANCAKGCILMGRRV